MRRLIFISLILWLCVQICFAQNVTHYETPSSPAFTVLNFEPASVMRPTTPSELRSSIFSFFDKEGKFVPNLGLEVSPYWLQSQPKLSSKEYLDPNFLQSVKQTFSISVATVKDSARGDNRFGLGIKFQPISPKITFGTKENEALQRQLDLTASAAGVRGLIMNGSIVTLKQAINALVALIRTDYGDKAAKFYQREFEEISKRFSDDKNDMLSFIEEILNTFDAQAVQIEVPRIRQGVLWELACATSFAESKVADFDNVTRLAFWSTLSFLDNNDEDLLLTLRYLGSQGGDTLRTAVDLGLSYVHDYERFNFSVEGILRSASAEFDDLNVNNETIRRIEREFTYRLALTGQYKINEFLFFNISLGKNYRDPLTTRGEFFSTAGLNFALFRPVDVQGKQ